VSEHDPGHACIRVIKPQIGDPGSGVVLVTGDPFRVTELTALQFDGQAVAAGQDDLDIASPPAVRGPGLHPGCEPLRLGPFPYRLLAFRMPQGAGLPSRTVVGSQMFVREVPLKKEVPLGAEARSCGDQK